MNISKKWESVVSKLIHAFLIGFIKISGLFKRFSRAIILEKNIDIQSAKIFIKLFSDWIRALNLIFIVFELY